MVGYVIKTKNGRYLTDKYGYSKDLQKAWVYVEEPIWALGPEEKLVKVQKIIVEIDNKE